MIEEVNLLEESAAVYRRPMTPERYAGIMNKPGMYDIQVEAGDNPDYVTHDQIGFTRADERLPPIHIDAAFQLASGGYEFLGYRDGQNSAVIGFVPTGENRADTRLIVSRVIGHLYQHLSQNNVSDMQIPILVQGWLNSELAHQSQLNQAVTVTPQFSRN